MPELPEVETVCRGLGDNLSIKSPIKKVSVTRYDLRVPIQKDVSKVLIGQTIQAVHRRAKYILFETELFTIISHLGMSGSWRYQDLTSRNHDHVKLEFESGAQMIFCDPRRFGMFRYVKSGTAAKSKWLKHLGVEPLEPNFNADYLVEQSKGRQVPVKTFLMNQNVVVGIGNIYASEILFHAGVRPLKKASGLSRADWQRVHESSKVILSRAIEQKGTTLKDYRQSSGEDGAFQNQLWVYGRNEQSCLKCKAPIHAKIVSGRSTYWCSKCQK